MTAAVSIDAGGALDGRVAHPASERQAVAVIIAVSEADLTRIGFPAERTTL
jgi:hypothetical protein